MREKKHWKRKGWVGKCEKRREGNSVVLQETWSPAWQMSPYHSFLHHFLLGAAQVTRNQKGTNSSTILKRHFYQKKLFPEMSSFKTIPLGLPWWRSGWESACQCRGHGFEPWSGRIPHAAERLGPWATTTEPAHLEPVLRNERPR